MRVLILHGWENNSKGNWFPWLKKELEKRGTEVYCPDLPNAENPKQKEWIFAAKKAAGIFGGDLSIIGHSLGAVAALRVIESLNENERIGKAVLVAGFTQNYGITPVADFFKAPFGWEKIRKNAKKIIVVNSDNDECVPLAEGEGLARMLGSEFIVEKNAGHINKKSGFLEYQRALELLVK